MRSIRLPAGGRRIRTCGPGFQGNLFFYTASEPQTGREPQTVLTTDNGKFTVGRARLAPAMIQVAHQTSPDRATDARRRTWKFCCRRVANERETAVKQALRQLLSDLLSTVLFLVVYAVSGSIFVAAGIAVTAGLLQLAFLRLMRRRIEPMQLMSLGLVVVLGGATMLTQSPRFMMIKPTIVHFAVAAVMLRPGWMIRYLPEKVVQNVPEPVIVAAGYGWAALLVALGLANLFIALCFDITTWVWFISVGSVGTKLAAFALQYCVFRGIRRQRLARSAT